MRARNPGAKTCRALYPNPISIRDAPQPGRGTGEHYCVGGAFLKYLNTGEPHRSFPSDGTVADALQSVNPRLNPFTALDHAKRIVTANDSGDIERAWSLLDQALNSD